MIGVIKRIWRTNHAAPILLVPTDNPKNEIVKAALAVQIKNIINVALSPGEQKDQLEKILTGYYAANGDREDIRAAEDEVAEDTRTLTSFVGQLYDAKQREEEREHTVIVRKKGTPQVLLEALGKLPVERKILPSNVRLTREEQQTKNQKNHFSHDRPRRRLSILGQLQQQGGPVCKLRQEFSTGG